MRSPQNRLLAAKKREEWFLLHPLSARVVLLEGVGKVDQREGQDRADERPELGRDTDPDERLAAFAAQQRRDGQTNVAHQTDQQRPAGNLRAKSGNWLGSASCHNNSRLPCRPILTTKMSPSTLCISGGSGLVMAVVSAYAANGTNTTDRATIERIELRWTKNAKKQAAGLAMLLSVTVRW